ncbi:MAG TPA: thioredoxin [Bacilli bacterium]|nr:thioredoxin [Bacilli bacterium]
MIYLENENLDDLVKEGNIIVDFYADWCGPCKMLGGILDQINSERSEVKIIKINVDKHQDLASKFAVMSIPRLILYKDGIEIKQYNGFVPKDEILKNF